MSYFINTEHILPNLPVEELVKVTDENVVVLGAANFKKLTTTDKVNVRSGAEEKCATATFECKADLGEGTFALVVKVASPNLSASELNRSNAVEYSREMSVQIDGSKITVAKGFKALFDVLSVGTFDAFFKCSLDASGKKLIITAPDPYFVFEKAEIVILSDDATIIDGAPVVPAATVAVVKTDNVEGFGTYRWMHNLRMPNAANSEPYGLQNGGRVNPDTLYSQVSFETRIERVIGGGTYNQVSTSLVPYHFYIAKENAVEFAKLIGGTVYVDGSENVEAKAAKAAKA